MFACCLLSSSNRLLSFPRYNCLHSFLFGLCLFPDAWGCMWWQATAVVCARLQESSAAPHARCGHPGHLTYRSSTVSIGRAQVTHLSPLTQLGKPNAITQAKRPSPGPCVQPGWKLSSCLAHQSSIHYNTFIHACCPHSSTTSVRLAADECCGASGMPFILSNLAGLIVWKGSRGG